MGLKVGPRRVRVGLIRVHKYPHPLTMTPYSPPDHAAPAEAATVGECVTDLPLPV